MGRWAADRMSITFPDGCFPGDCQFPIIEIGDEYEDPSGLLTPGMEVMGPCDNCGLSVNEYMSWLDKELQDHAKGIDLLQSHKNVPLFHWSPSKNRKQIVRFGLLPGRRPTTHSELKWRAPYICFADDPGWAWMLSGGMASSPYGEWDLWQTWYNELVEPEALMSDEGNGVHEYRTRHRVFKRSVKYLGSRNKE